MFDKILRSLFGVRDLPKKVEPKEYKRTQIKPVEHHRALPQSDYPNFDDLFPEPIEPFPPLLVQRIPRANGVEFLGGASWLGGAPMLGDVDWPQANGIPMHHLATIDCSELRSISSLNQLPEKGQLAFFAALNTAPYTGAVRYIAAPRHVPVPNKLPLLCDKDSFVRGVDHVPASTDNGLLPRWPVRIHKLPTNGDNAEIEEVIRRYCGEKSRYSLSINDVAEFMPCGENVWCWDGIQRLAAALLTVGPEQISRKIKILESAQLRKEKDVAASKPESLERNKLMLANNSVDLNRLRTGYAEFREFAEDFAVWAGSHYRWSPLGPSDIARFEQVFALTEYHEYAEERTDFGIFADSGDRPVRDQKSLASLSLKAAVTAAPEVFELLPKEVQELTDIKYRRPARLHQMFGNVDDIQAELEPHANKHVLLQLSWDDVMNMTFGDVGVVQYVISPEDLDAGQFEAAIMVTNG